MRDDSIPAGGSSHRPDLEREADRQRIAAYLDGSPEAIRELEDWIRREIGARYSVLRAELDDVCQAVHSKLVANLRAGQFLQLSSLRTYVTGVAHHTAVDRIRVLDRDRAIFSQGAAPQEP